MCVRGSLVAERQIAAIDFREFLFLSSSRSSSSSSAKRKVITVDSTGLAERKLVDFISSFESGISLSVCVRVCVLGEKCPQAVISSPPVTTIARCQKAPDRQLAVFFPASQPPSPARRLVRLHSLRLRGNTAGRNVPAAFLITNAAH